MADENSSDLSSYLDKAGTLASTLGGLFGSKPATPVSGTPAASAASPASGKKWLPWAIGGGIALVLALGFMLLRRK